MSSGNYIIHCDQSKVTVAFAIAAGPSAEPTLLALMATVGKLADGELGESSNAPPSLSPLNLAKGKLPRGKIDPSPSGYDPEIGGEG